MPSLLKNFYTTKRYPNNIIENHLVSLVLHLNYREIPNMGKFHLITAQQYQPEYPSLLPYYLLVIIVL